MQYTVIDLETTVRNPTGFKASPWCLDNKVVLVGWAHGRGPVQSAPSLSAADVPEEAVLVGHNIKFDLHYLCRDSKWQGWLHKCQVWDTMIVDYLLSGQLNRYSSLDDCAALVGGTLKDQRIAEYWEQGLDTTDIPIEQLTEYLHSDVSNTRRVFLNQLEQVKLAGMLPLIWSNMAALVATITMERAGMFFDKDLAAEHVSALSSEAEVIRLRVVDMLRSMLPEGIEINSNSRHQLSKALYGGMASVSQAKPILNEAGEEVRYKTGSREGQVKTRLTTIDVPVTGCSEPPPGPVPANGIYSVNDEALRGVAAGDGRVLANDVLALRGLDKDINTYYIGYSNSVWPDGLIHHSLEFVNTATGRLNCVKPNLQNVSGGD
ncbi:MAG: DNA polymerase [Gammaproteobacteria bacterium]